MFSTEISTLVLSIMFPTLSIANSIAAFLKRGSFLPIIPGCTVIVFALMLSVVLLTSGMNVIAKEEVPEIEIHISTQANNVNYGTYRFWHRMGAARVVSGRELSLAEIKELVIKWLKKVPADRFDNERIEAVLFCNDEPSWRYKERYWKTCYLRAIRETTHIYELVKLIYKLPQNGEDLLAIFLF